MKLNLKERVKSIMFWVWVSIIITLILGIITRITQSDTMLMATVISCIPWGLFAATSIIYVWVISPIKWLINKFKK